MRTPLTQASLAALALFLGLQTQQAKAQNYYVAANGSDSSGNGSISAPWATISRASTQAGPGAVVHVAAGVYNGSFNTSSSGTSSAYITYQAETSNFSSPVNCAQVAANHGDLTVCPRLVGGSSTTWVNSGNYVTIKGFDVTGGGINGLYSEGNATVITQNHVHDILPSTCNSTGGSGINLNGTNATVTNNYVHNIGPYPSSCGFVQGIYFLKAGGSAYNNVSFNNSGFGIQLWHQPSNIALVNNTLFNNASGGIVLGSDDSGFTVDYVTVSNNIISNNGGDGVSEQGASSSSTGIHNYYSNNLVYGNAGSAFSLQNGLNAYSTITSAPAFVSNTGNKTGDYHLQSGSPAIGKATASGSPSTDFDGNARPQSGSYDIGSYEYGSVATASTGTFSLSHTTLSFPSTTVGASSAIQYSTFTNTGNSTITFNSGFAISGPFAFGGQGTCGSTVAPGANCTISVVFSPTASGNATGTVTLYDSAGTQTISLNGSGTLPYSVSISPAALSFSQTRVGSTSAINYATVTNTGSSTVTFNGAFAVSGPFAFGGQGTCGATLAPAASCTVSVVYRPTARGTASGAVTLNDSAGMQTIALSGSGK